MSDNLIALRQILVKGVVVEVGEVIPKTAFEESGDWKNLVNMKPPRLAETDAKVGKPGKAGKTLPGVA